MSSGMCVIYHASDWEEVYKMDLTVKAWGVIFGFGPVDWTVLICHCLFRPSFFFSFFYLLTQPSSVP